MAELGANPSPAEWLEFLDAKLEARRPYVQHFVDYRRGQHRLSGIMRKYAQDFREFFGPNWSDNWCRPVVNSAVERLQVVGMNFGGQRATTMAWRVWQENRMDAKSVMAHRESITCGEAYALVTPPVNGGLPRITVEHPLQMVVEMSEDDPDVRDAALKKTLGRDGFLRAFVYLPDGVYRFRSRRKPQPGQKIEWVWDAARPRLPNPAKVVLAVPLTNGEDMLIGGVSDLDGADDMNDAINLFVLQMATSGHLLALPQRILAGIESETDPLTGASTSDAFASFVSKLVTSPNPDVKWGQFAAADLSNFKTAVEMLLQHLAAQTRTPPHYLIGQVVNASGDALKAAETGLTERCKEKLLPFGDGWEEAMRVAFLAMGDTTNGNYRQAETAWRNPENRSEAELADAAVKKRAVDVPIEYVWADMGYTPQQIEEMKKLNAALPSVTGATEAEMAGANPEGSAAGTQPLEIPGAPAAGDASAPPAPIVKGTGRVTGG